jgi:hypothetical protein
MTMDAIEKIKDPKIVELRQEVARHEQELAQASSQIPKLKMALEGQAETPEATYGYEETRQLFEETQAEVFSLRKKIAESCKELEAAAAKWSAEIAKKYPKLILSSRVKAVECLKSITRAQIGEGEYTGPSVLGLYHRYQETSREASELCTELALAHEVAGSACPPMRGVPSLLAWPQFLERLAKNPHWWGENWDDVLSAEEQEKLKEESRELSYRTDPGLRQREQAMADYAAEEERKRREEANLTLAERAEQGKLTGADLFMLMRAKGSGWH